jgi:hypothetical protein
LDDDECDDLQLESDGDDDDGFQEQDAARAAGGEDLSERENDSGGCFWEEGKECQGGIVATSLAPRDLMIS